MTEYYIVDNKEKKGPFIIDELKKMNISFDTLVWTKGLSNWTKANEIDELKPILESIPPPIPNTVLEKKEDKNINAKKERNKEPRIDSPKDKTDSNKRNRVIATEIKLAGKIALISIIIGLISFPFLSYKGFKAINLKTKYEAFKYHKSDYFNNDYEYIGSEKFERDFEKVKSEIIDLVTTDEIQGMKFNLWGQWSYTSILHYTKNKIKKAVGISFGISLLAFLSILLLRYFFIGSKKGINWVSINSK